jgi:hypothetical protein
LVLETLSVTSLKMLKYHERNEEEPAPTPVVDVAADLGTEEVDKYYSIAAQYGLDMDIGASEGVEQTIDQEYQAYITAPLVARKVNILKFWEVCDIVNDILVLSMGLCRLTKGPFPLFSRWQWTTCLSKRLPSLVSAFFRQVLRQIPSDGIVLALS